MIDTREIDYCRIWHSIFHSLDVKTMDPGRDFLANSRRVQFSSANTQMEECARNELLLCGQVHWYMYITKTLVSQSHSMKLNLFCQSIASITTMHALCHATRRRKWMIFFIHSQGQFTIGCNACYMGAEVGEELMCKITGGKSNWTLWDLNSQPCMQREAHGASACIKHFSTVYHSLHHTWHKHTYA